MAGSIWDNKSGASLTLSGAASFPSNAGSTLINEAGATVTKTGARTSNIHWGVTNHGTISVLQGLMEFLANKVTTDGTVSVADGAALQVYNSDFTSTGTFSLDSGATLTLSTGTLGSGTTITGAGSTMLDGTTTLGGAVSLANLAWLPNAAFTGANAALTLSGTVVLNPGSANADEFLYASSGAITVNSLGQTDIFAPANTNDGLYDNGSGTAVWNNVAGGVFTLHDSASLLVNAGSVFTNAAGGTFAHVGSQTGVVAWGFVNHGLLNVTGGTLLFSGSTLTSDGTVSVSAGATLALSQTTLGDGTTLAVNGGGSAALLDTLTLSGTATISNLVWSANALLTGTDATVTLGGAVVLNPGAGNAHEFLYANEGVITVNSVGLTDVFAPANTNDGLHDDSSGSAVWNNLTGGVFTLHDSASVLGNTGSVFTNAAGGSFVHVGSQTGLVEWGFVNHGLINVTGGTLEFYNTSLTSDGTLSVSAGATLALSQTTLGDGTTLAVNGGGSAALLDTLTLSGTATISNLVWSANALLTGTDATVTLGGAVVLNPGAGNAHEFLYANEGVITVNSVGLTDVFAPANTNDGLHDDSSGSAVWNNLTGGVFTLHDSASVLGYSGSVFTNATGGSFVHVGSQTGLVEWGFVNHGLINVTGGTLEFDNTSLTSDGTVSVSAGATLAFSQSTLGDGTSLLVNGGGSAALLDTLTVAGTATITNLVWNPSAVLTGRNATVTLGGAVVLNPGAANANEYLYANCRLITVNSVGLTEVFAPANTNDGLSDNGSGTAIWNNQSGGVFTLHDSASVLGSSSSVFTNLAGGSLVHDGSQTGVVEWGLVNHGLINVAGGTLEFSDTTLTSDGTVSVSAGATLAFSQSTLGDGTTLAVNGGGSAALLDTLTLAGAATISNLVWSPNALLTGADSTVTLGGAVVLNPGSGNANENLYASTGEITVNSVGLTDVFAPANTNDGLYDSNTGTTVWNNLAGGVFTLHDSASVLGSAGSVFTNAVGGIFAHTGGQTGLVEWGFVNHGLINVTGGTLEFSDTTLTSDGTVSVSAGASLAFSDSTLGDGTTLAVNGGGSAALLDTLTLAGTATVSNLVWAPNAVLTGKNATVTLGGTVVLNPGEANANEYLYANCKFITVNSVGLTDVFAPANTNDGLYDNGSGTAVWNNLAGGVFTLHDSASVLGNPGSVFTNAVGGSFVHTGSQTGVVQWAFNNAGSVEVQAGTLTFQGTVGQDDGVGDLTGGTWIVDSNAALVFPDNPSFTTIAGGAAVTLNGAGSTFAAINSLTANNGTFQLLGGSGFTTVGDFANNGLVAVDGSSSILNVSGILTVGGPGTLSLTNGGTANIGGTGPANGAVNILNGGTLTGQGMVNGNVILDAGGAIAPGFGGIVRVAFDGPGGPGSPGGPGLGLPSGTLTLNGNVTFNGGGILNFSLGAGSGQLNLTGGTFTGPASGALTVNITGLDGFGNGTYALIDFISGTALDLTAGDFVIGTAPVGFNYGFEVTADTVSLDVSGGPIPEPSTVALLTGLGALALAALRRRPTRRS